MISKKIKAGSLQLVTFIVIIIALLLMSFILLIHTHKQYRIRTNHVIEAVKLSDSGISYALNNNRFESDTVAVNLFDEDYKKLKVHKDYWGTFEKINSKASIKNNTLRKIALAGSILDTKNPTALFLKDNNKPLVLVGHTKIEGKAFLPKRGVKSGNISGQSYYNEKYIYGTTTLSKKFPTLDKKLLEHIETLTNGSLLTRKNTKIINLTSSKTHSNSFKDPIELVYSNDAIFLSDISITGHIVIQSKTKITVDSSSDLQDVILVAPDIEISSNVKGTFQAFATERISIDQNVILDYPSALVLKRDYKKENSSKTYSIEISNNSIIKGNILALGQTLPDNYEAQIKIHPNAIIKGFVYCEQNLELRGTVLGAVYTNNFMIIESGSNYQNHLYNAKISSTELEQEFVGFPLTNSKKRVAKWLY